MVKRLSLALLGWALSCAVPAMAQQAPIVLAAASLQESMTEAASIWAARGHPKPVLSFAASSALARQAAAGAPADMFVSADEPWMDDLDKRGLLRSGSRVRLLGGRLVLVSARAERGAFALRPNAPLAKLLGDSRLAMADPDAVPAGKYGKAALQKLNIWNSVEARVVRGDSVRSALALVERGAARFGIVYETDARASPNVRVMGVFPPGSHPPIVYPMALLKRSTNTEAEGFRRFLLSDEGRAIFRKHGFRTR